MIRLALWVPLVASIVVVVSILESVLLKIRCIIRGILACVVVGDVSLGVVVWVVSKITLGRVVISVWGEIVIESVIRRLITITLIETILCVVIVKRIVLSHVGIKWGSGE